MPGYFVKLSVVHSSFPFPILLISAQHDSRSCMLVMCKYVCILVKSRNHNGQASRHPFLRGSFLVVTYRPGSTLTKKTNVKEADGPFPGS